MIILIIIILNEFFKKEYIVNLEMWGSDSNNIYYVTSDAVFWILSSFPSITPLSILFSNVFSQTDNSKVPRSTQKYSTGPHKNGEANFTHEWPKVNFTHVSKRTLHTILRCELYTRF